MHPILSAVHVTKIFPAGRGVPVIAVQDFSLEVADGEFVCLLGASGCGKTTMLNIFAGFHAAHLRRGDFARSTDYPRRTTLRHGVPVLCSVSLEDRARECRVRPENAAYPACATPRTRRAFYRHGEVAGIRKQLSGGTVRRHAAARHAGPIARCRPGSIANGTNRSPRWTR